jgi:hypothetical protein
MISLFFAKSLERIISSLKSPLSSLLIGANEEKSQFVNRLIFAPLKDRVFEGFEFFNY